VAQYFNEGENLNVVWGYSFFKDKCISIYFFDELHIANK
jgi:hypothetical protein